jgi:demethoxyubiquinone hydroxylase (CLK1/Coq7/Cat5 family)
MVSSLEKFTLRDLRIEDIQSFHNRLIKQNVRPTTIRKIHHVLQHSLNLAAESGVIGSDQSKYIGRVIGYAIEVHSTICHPGLFKRDVRRSQM